MDELISMVATELSARSDPAKVPGMAAYLKTDMAFYGVQKRGRAEVFRAIRKHFPINDNAGYRTAVEALWTQPHREEKYLAISIAKDFKQYVTSENLDLYERLVVEGSWWDLVDDVAINCVGIAFLNERAEVEPAIRRWIDDEDMWLRRTSLISHIKHKAATDRQLLFDHCLQRAPEKEFFIRKAIGWTLREYAKTEPARVRSFLLDNRDAWSGLTLREAGKHLDV